MQDKLRCRYSDCVEGHPTTNEEEQVTCPTCRRDLGLPLLDAHITGKKNPVVQLTTGDRHYLKGQIPEGCRRTGNGYPILSPMMKTVCDIAVALFKPVDDKDVYIQPMTCMICMTGGEA